MALVVEVVEEVVVVVIVVVVEVQVVEVPLSRVREGQEEGNRAIGDLFTSMKNIPTATSTHGLKMCT